MTPSHARVVIVGGGIVGCAVAYWLARRGWSDVVLLERGELTCGSTWHAAGNVTQFGHYSEITRLYVNSIRTYRDAEAASGMAIGFHEAGSLRLATTALELAAYERLEPLYAGLGVPYTVVGPDRIARLHPLLELDGVLGAASTPTDGHLDPSAATQAMAAFARDHKIKIYRNEMVEGISSTKSGWRVETDDRVITCENLVLATSFWTRELVAHLGLSPPLFAVEHHEVITEPIPELAALGFEVPTVRDPWAPSNTRQEGHGFLCGVYEAAPKPWRTDGVPRDFPQQLLPPDLDRLMPHLERVMARLPAFGRAGIKAANNGPLCYTPDGLPMVGPIPSHPGLWFCTGFNVGIGTGGGAAEYLTHWIVEGAPDDPIPMIHADRFGTGMQRAEAVARITRTYAAGYATPT